MKHAGHHGCRVRFEGHGLDDERGANLVEYMVIVGCVALLALGGWARFGHAVEEKITAQAACVTSFAGCDGDAAGATPASTSGAEPTEQGETQAPLTYPEQVAQSLQTLGDHYTPIAGDDGTIDEDDLEAALQSADPAVRDAAQFFLDNSSALHALDVGRGEGDVDGHISREDIAGLQEALASGQLETILADTANGEGGRDGEIARDDLQALIDDPGIPPELQAWAVEQLASMPEEHHCGRYDFGCRAGGLAGGAVGWAADTAGGAIDWTADAGSGAVDWAGDTASTAASGAWDWGTETALPFALDYTPLGYQVGGAHAIWDTGAGVVWTFHHPLDAFEGFNHALAHPVETLYVVGAGLVAGVGESPAQGLGYGAWTVGSAFIPTTGAVRTIGYGTDATSAADAGNGAVNGEVPGWVSIIDDLSIGASPLSGPARVVEWIEPTRIWPFGD